MKRIGGFDNHGTLYDDGERMRRSVEEDYLASALLVFETLRNDLLRLGIVQTEYDSKERVFTHKKHIISYPYEWTVGMFKEAALFHLDLLQNLEAKDLTLKDALPSNIVFDFTDPVFVDFLSVVPIEALDKEEWLVTVAGGRDHDLRHAVLRSMYYPFFLIPMLQMGRRQYRKARAQLSTQACNTGNGRPRLERRSTPRRLLDLLRASVGIRNNRTAETLILLCFRWMLSGQSADFGHWIARLQQLIRQLNVTPPTSGYSKFYELKNENYDITGRSDWKAKQINVHRVLEQAVPRRVLDIGANTGWYSLLAEKQGAEVIAVDVDESSIETLYQYSRNRRLRILSLNIPFGEIETEILGNRGLTTKRVDESNCADTPLFIRATERLRADLVLFLGLLHHLVLGEGRSLDQIFSILDKLANRTVVMEFVGLDDPLVVAEPSFFPSIGKYSRADYNLDVVIRAGLGRFKTYRVLDSNSSTRQLLVFEK